MAVSGVTGVSAQGSPPAPETLRPDGDSATVLLLLLRPLVKSVPYCSVVDWRIATSRTVEDIVAISKDSDNSTGLFILPGKGSSRFPSTL